MAAAIQSKSPRWKRLGLILVRGVLASLVVCVFLLQVVSFLFSLHDRSMKSFASRMVTDRFGHRLRCYQLDQPGARWNIVFIHGTPATAAVFGEQFRHPFPAANLIAFDRPGFGASKPDQRLPSLEDQANAVAAVLPTTERATILVGHSYGAPIALLAALKFTNQVAGVVLIGGSVDPAQERTYAIQRFADWAPISWLVPHPLRQCNRELLTLRGDLVRLKPQLSALLVPLVILHGGNDHQVPVANVEYLHARFVAAGKTNLFGQLVFPSYNHFIPWEHPDAVEAAIRELTNGLDAIARNH